MASSKVPTPLPSLIDLPHPLPPPPAVRVMLLPSRVTLTVVHTSMQEMDGRLGHAELVIVAAVMMTMMVIVISCHHHHQLTAFQATPLHMACMNGRMPAVQVTCDV